jgi:predicted acyl esterase
MISLLFLATIVSGQTPDETRKLEIMLPMRDGVKLHTLIFFPREDGVTTKYTAIVDRSPYGFLCSFEF